MPEIAAANPPAAPLAKADGAMRTIGEVSAELGIKPHILRYWEAQFDMLEPLKRAGGRRYYRAQDVAMLHQIDRLLNRDGFTVRGARQFLAMQNPAQSRAQNPAKPTAESNVRAGQNIDTVKLGAIRDALAAALEAV